MKFPPDSRLTTAETANYLGVRADTVAYWRMRGNGPPFLRIGGRINYRIDDLDAWIAANSERSSAR